MNSKELDSDKPLDESRCKRLARGAGVKYVEVLMLMEEFKNFKKVISGLSGINMGKGKKFKKIIFRQRALEHDEEPQPAEGEDGRCPAR